MNVLSHVCLSGTFILGAGRGQKSVSDPLDCSYTSWEPLCVCWASNSGPGKEQVVRT